MINFQDYDKLNKEFNDTSKPYRYVVIDNFFNDDIANQLCDDYPSQDDTRWYRFRDKIEGIKNVLEQGMYGISKKEDMSDLWVQVLSQLNSLEYCKTLEKMTGFTGIIPDTYNDGLGHWTGLRFMKEGSHQLIHSDARLHPHLKLEKKLTIVGWMNKDWKESDSGHLEVWNDEMTECVEKVEPLFNRVILFDNTETAYHGVPKVNSYRKSFLLSLLKDTENYKEVRPKALFVKRPNEPDEELIDKIAEARANLTDY